MVGASLGFMSYFSSDLQGNKANLNYFDMNLDEKYRSLVCFIIHCQVVWFIVLEHSLSSYYSCC